MAHRDGHPYSQHRQHLVEHARALKHVLHHPHQHHGGPVAHSDAHGSHGSAVHRKKHEKPHRAAGGAVKARLDRRKRGGKVKHRDEGGPVESEQNLLSKMGTQSGQLAASQMNEMGKRMSDDDYENARERLIGRGQYHGNRKQGGKVSRAKGGRVHHKGKTNVNIVVGHPAPQQPPMMPAPAVAMPPPRPVAPPMGVGPPGMPPGLPPGLPPGGPPPGAMGPRKSGGRTYAKGGRVHDDEKEDRALFKRMMAEREHKHHRARGGSVKDGPAWKEGIRAGTNVQHLPGKNDGKDVNRGPVITRRHGGSVHDKVTPERYGADTGHEDGPNRKAYRKTGGRIWSDPPTQTTHANGPINHATHGQMAPNLHVGAGGGTARLKKQARARSHYAKPQGAHG